VDPDNPGWVGSGRYGRVEDVSKHHDKSGSPPKRAPNALARSTGSAKRQRHRTIFLNINRPNVSVVLGRPDQGIPLTFIDTTTGERIENLGPETVEAGITYARENKGPKVITRFGTSADYAGIDPNEKLLDYDHVFGVDTNTDPLTGKSVSVLVWLANLRHEPDGWKIDPRFPPAFVFRGRPGPNPEANPEKIGWRDAIERIFWSPEFQGRVALLSLPEDTVKIVIKPSPETADKKRKSSAAIRDLIEIREV
jgi:hypothetical protein